ncbi:Uncharacterised protein [Mycobacteroides abscessus subsp. massiliense]|nr:Uncharacterised protein [Mycobacteroides abscessus subsp. massiliense]
MPRSVLPHQARTHHRTIGVDDPLARLGECTVIGIGICQLEAVAGRREHRGAPARPCQPRRPQTRLPNAAIKGNNLDLAIESGLFP